MASTSSKIDLAVATAINTVDGFDFTIFESVEMVSKYHNRIAIEAAIVRTFAGSKDEKTASDFAASWIGAVSASKPSKYKSRMVRFALRFIEGVTSEVLASVDVVFFSTVLNTMDNVAVDIRGLDAYREGIRSIALRALENCSKFQSIIREKVDNTPEALSFSFLAEFECRKGKLDELFIEKYIEMALSSEISADVVAICFKHVIAQISSEVFAQKVSPLIFKALRRDPKSSLALLASEFFIPQLQFDFGSLFAEIVSVIAAESTAKDESTSVFARKAVENIVKTCKNNEIIMQIIDSLLSLNTSKNGKPKRDVLYTLISNLQFASLSEEAIMEVKLSTHEKLFSKFKGESTAPLKIFESFLIALQKNAIPIGDSEEVSVHAMVDMITSKQAQQARTLVVLEVLALFDKVISAKGKTEELFMECIKSPNQSFSRSAIVLCAKVSVKLGSFEVVSSCFGETLFSSHEFVEKLSSHEKRHLADICTILVAEKTSDVLYTSILLSSLEPGLKELEKALVSSHLNTLEMITSLHQLLSESIDISRFFRFYSSSIENCEISTAIELWLLSHASSHPLKHLPTTFSENISQFIQSLPKLLKLSQVTHLKDPSIAAFASLCAFPSLFTAVLDSIMAAIDMTLLTSISEYDIGIFHTEEGALCPLPVHESQRGKQISEKQLIHGQSQRRKEIRNALISPSLFLLVCAGAVKVSVGGFKEYFAVVFPMVKRLAMIPMLSCETGDLFLGLSALLDRHISEKQSLIVYILQSIRDSFVLSDSSESQVYAIINGPVLSKQCYSLLFPLLDLILHSSLPKHSALSSADIFKFTCAHAEHVEGLEAVKDLFFLLADVVCANSTLFAIAVTVPSVAATKLQQHPLFLLSDRALSHPNHLVRRLAVEMVEHYPHTSAIPSIQPYIWLLSGDVDEISAFAKMFIEKNELIASNEVVDTLITFLCSQNPEIRDVAMNAIAQVSHSNESVIDKLIDTFQYHNDRIVTSDLSITERFIDNSFKRRHVLLTLQRSLPLDSQRSLQVLRFVLNIALKDSTWESALSLGISLIDTISSGSAEIVLTVIEDRLMSLGGIEKQIADQIKEACVIFMGNAAKNLDKTNRKIHSVLKLLFEVLQTPSYNVQLSAAQCIAPLMKHTSEGYRTAKIDELLSMLKEASSYGDRKGAAFGLSGVVKGLRVSSLRKYGVMDTLIEMISSDAFEHKQSALFAFDALFQFIGARFEPYIVYILPHLLQCFGDSSQMIREATQDTARTIMGNLTSHGVKLILPIITEALESPQWRTKVESINLLGTMAFCAPEQLSSFLPVVVPQLMTILRHPHQKVQIATQNALRDIGSVIENTEMQEMTTILLKALYDPPTHSEKALQALITTSFTSAIDTAALSLVFPILQRGLRMRAGNVKRMAAQIIGSICSFLRNKRDLVPYVSFLIDELKQSLVDPNPDVRAASSKALGHLYRELGDAHMSGILEWLLDMLETKNGQVDRSGGAQGLAEILAAVDGSQLDGYISLMLSKLKTQDSNTKEAFIMVFAFLPKSLGPQFINYVDAIFPILVRCFADDKGSIRNVAIQTGKSIIDSLGSEYPHEILNHLTLNMVHPVWRVRETCAILVGDLMHRVVGKNISIISGDQIEFDEDENLKPELDRLILEAIGDKRDTVFSLLYMLQSDSTPSVRQTSLLVWKALVHNTTRLLGGILDVFITICMDTLVSGDEDMQVTAGKSFGELVHRTGKLILPRVIPIFIVCVEDGDVMKRKGVYIALCEIIASASKSVVEEHMDEFVSLLRKGISDESVEVRMAAASAFDSMFRCLGKPIVSKTIPDLLKEMAANEEKNDFILDGIKQVLKLRAAVILSHLIPFLLESKVNAFTAKAFAALAPVCGDNLLKFMKNIVSAFLNCFESKSLDEMESSAELDFFNAFGTGIGSKCLEQMVSLISNAMIESNASVVYACGSFFSFFCSNSESDIESFIPSIVNAVAPLLAHKEVRLQIVGISVFDSISDELGLEKLVTHTETIRMRILAVTQDKRGRALMDQVPAFAIKNAIKSIITLYLHAIMYGDVKQREMAAFGIQDVVRLSTSSALDSFVIKITGPLIRIAGDNFDCKVKVSILNTLSLLLEKNAKFLRPFVPQLQTTFSKALSDPNGDVRRSAGLGLANLMVINDRKLNQLMDDMMHFVEDHEGLADITTSYLKAMEMVLEKVKSLISTEKVTELIEFSKCMMKCNTESIRQSSGSLYGALLSLSGEIGSALTEILNSKSSNEINSHSALCALLGILEHHQSVPSTAQIIRYIASNASHHSEMIRSISVLCGFHLLCKTVANAKSEESNLLLPVLVGLSEDSVPSIRALFLDNLKSTIRKLHLFYSVNADVVAPTLIRLRSDLDIYNRVDTEKVIVALLGGPDRDLYHGEMLIKRIVDPETKRCLNEMLSHLK